MNKTVLAATLVITALLLAQPPARACGEGLFNLGQGLRYQGYLAPRPATLLVYDRERAPDAGRIAVYRGLVRAGHRLTIAHDPDELAQAMRERRYDVVIAGYDNVDMVAAATASAASAPKLLPVVARNQRNTPTLRSRFGLFLLDGASLGQHLKSIDQLVKGKIG